MKKYKILFCIACVLIFLNGCGIEDKIKEGTYDVVVTSKDIINESHGMYDTTHYYKVTLLIPELKKQATLRDKELFNLVKINDKFPLKLELHYNEENKLYKIKRIKLVDKKELNRKEN